MRGLVAIVLAFAAGLIATAVLSPPHDGDLWWQTWLGATILRTHAIPHALGNETFSAPGAPWTPHEWLFSVVLAWASAHGLHAVFALAVAACALGAVVIVAASALRRGASPLAAAVAAALTTIAMIPPLGLRVQVIAWLFVAAFAPLALDPKRRLWCVPLAIVWANVHASVMLAPVTMLVVLGCEIVGRVRRRAASADSASSSKPIVRDALAVAGTLVAPFCTPLGARLPSYAIAMAESPIRRYIVEWQSPLHSAFGCVEIAVATLVLAAVLVPSRRVSENAVDVTNSTSAGTALARRGVALAYYALALLATRHVPAFFLVVAPLAASRFHALPSGARGVRGASALALDATLAAFACVAGVVAALASTRSHQPLPYSAVSYVARDADGVRLFCSDFAWCGMAVGRPGVRVFLDGRADPYPPSLFALTVAARSTPDGASAVVRSGANAALVAAGEPLARELAGSGRWWRAFVDERYAVFRLRR